MAITPGNLFIMCPGIIYAVVTETDTLALGLHFMLRETLKSGLDFAKADVADGQDNQTNEDDKIRNAGKHFYFELLNVCFFNTFL